MAKFRLKKDTLFGRLMSSTKEKIKENYKGKTQDAITSFSSVTYSFLSSTLKEKHKHSKNIDQI